MTSLLARIPRPKHADPDDNQSDRADGRPAATRSGGRHADPDATSLIERIPADPPAGGLTKATPAKDADATSLLPRVPADADATSLIPRIPADGPTSGGADAATSIIPRISDPDPDSAATRQKFSPDPDKADPESASGTTPQEEPAKPATQESEKGVLVVPLRPVRTEEGYRSVYSDYTRRSVGSVVRAVSRGVGEVLITFGLIVLLFAAYEIYGKTAIVNAHQKVFANQLNQQWANNDTVGGGGAAGAGQPADGAVIAKLYVPRMKGTKPWIVLQGVSPEDIQYAPGHYPDTAMPGQVGNFAVAGHRTPAIFWDEDQLRSGDPILVQTATTWYIYRVVQKHIVTPTTVAVVAAVPNEPGVTPTKAMLTMTTCNPKYDNYQRLIVHAELVRTQPTSAGNPTELGG